MSEIQKKFSDLIVYNSVTNKLPDAKYDITKAFSFVEFLNYVKVLDDDNTENFEQFKLYLKNWELIDTTNNRQNAISLRGQYINFFNELLLVYSTSEEKRYFSNLDLNDVESLTNAIPFFTRKINEIVNTCCLKQLLINLFQIIKVIRIVASYLLHCHLKQSVDISKQ